MLILGLLLVVLALVVFGYMFLGTRDLDALQVDLGIFTVELTPLHLYLLGAATLVVLVLGLLALAAGVRASRRRRREVKDLRKAVRDGGVEQDRTRVRDSAGRHPDAAPPPADSAPPRSDRQADDAGSYEREVPSGSPDGAPGEHSPQRDPRDVALPGDYGRDHPDADGPRRP